MGNELRVRRVGTAERSAVLGALLPAAEENLVLIDSVRRLGASLGPGEVPPQIYVAFRGDQIAGVLTIRPSLVLSAGMAADVLDVLMPFILRVPSGLMKCDAALVRPVWEALEKAGRRATIDRIEIAYRLRPEDILPFDGSAPGVARPAREEDLDELVFAARASLWEEDRPDPSEGDPRGFERWVRGRLPRARLVQCEGRIVFVGYADIRRAEGWLVQGVYTWPDDRRRGFARRGMDSIIREALASGASHVQLAVVDGNERAAQLYEALGFEAFGTLRTVLFQ